MTGEPWPNLPDAWSVGQVKNLATVTLGKMLQSADSGGDVAAPYLRAANVQPDGVLDVAEVKEMWFRERELGLLAIRHGDVLVVEGGQGGYGRAAFVPGDLTGYGFQNSINRLRPKPGNDGGFLSYYLIALRASGFVKAYCNAVSMPHLTSEKLAGVPLPIPPGDEQSAIADYLDRETAQIDTLIAEQQRLIDLLRERRDSLWSTLFAEAEGSGPSVPMRRLLSSIVDGPFGSSLTSAHYSDEGVRVIRLGNIGVNEFRDQDVVFIPSEYAAQLSGHAALAGDVVIAGLGDEKWPLGRAAVVPEIGPAIVKADCYRARPTEAISPQFLAWALSAPPTRSQIGLLARGATRARLNTSVVQNVTLPAPPMSVQERLIGTARDQTGKIDRLIAETERFIELSRERRNALITAAVTGQIDVRDVA